MAGRRELGFPRTNVCSLREQAARTTLRNVRLQGHTYVEIREDGKRFIFFCTICLAPCYSDSILFDHLKGNLHSERYAAAKVTLLGQNPWPFSDGVLFFHGSSNLDKHDVAVSNSNQNRLLNVIDNTNDLTVVNGDKTISTKSGDYVRFNGGSHSKNLNADGGNCSVVIPGIVCKDEISDLEVSFIGCGEIAARISSNDEISSRISGMWCGWLGKEYSNNSKKLRIPDYDFAVITFSYNCDLGRQWVYGGDLSPTLSSSPRAVIENVECVKKKRKKSFSDPEDISESMSDQCGSSGEESPAFNSPSRLSFDRYDDQFHHARFISSKSGRRELRRQQRAAAERMCDVCQHKMLPGKDVAALLNMNTGKLACSSRNLNGAFHVFHTSCLIHWILLCESEIWTNQLSSSNITRVSGRKNGTKCSKRIDDERRAARKQFQSVFCPECQGTGINIEGEQLEKPTVPVSEMFNYKIKLSDAHRAWMKSPEILHECSTGLHFPCKSEETVQEKVSPLKLLRFYRANE